MPHRSRAVRRPVRVRDCPAAVSGNNPADDGELYRTFDVTSERILAVFGDASDAEA
jgi:hypothetical protein